MLKISCSSLPRYDEVGTIYIHFNLSHIINNVLEIWFALSDECFRNNNKIIHNLQNNGNETIIEIYHSILFIRVERLWGWFFIYRFHTYQQQFTPITKLLYNWNISTWPINIIGNKRFIRNIIIFYIYPILFIAVLRPCP